MYDSVWLRLVLSVLAVWRITHLIAAEDGPWNVIVHIRRHLGHGFFGTLADCFQCLSMWVSIPFALFAVSGPAFTLVTWLALSGAACLLERAGGAQTHPLVFEAPSEFISDDTRAS